MSCSFCKDESDERLEEGGGCRVCGRTGMEDETWGLDLDFTKWMRGHIRRQNERQAQESYWNK